MFSIFTASNYASVGELPTSEDVYVSVYIDYIGEKVKLSDVYKLYVRVAFRNDVEDSEKDMRVMFLASVPLGDLTDFLPIAALRNVYIEQEKVFNIY